MEYYNYDDLEGTIPKNPVTEIKLSSNSAYAAPVFKESSNKKWVNFVDNDKNQYPDRLIYYKNNSALHGAIIKSITRQYIGNGFSYDTSTNKSKATSQFLNDIDSNEFLSRVAADLKTFGGIAIAVVWSKDYKKINFIEHVDLSKLRAAVVDPSTSKVPGYFYSWKWDTQRPSTIFIPAFSEETAKENAETYKRLYNDLDLDPKNLQAIEDFFSEPTTQLLYWKPYDPGSFYYPLPDYVGGINAIRTNILTDQYGVNSMENGLAIDFMVSFIGQYDDEAKRKEGNAFIKQFTNPAKKKLPLIAFAQDKEHLMQIENISGVNEDKNYTKINENSTQEILNAHSIVSPLLVGIKTPGQLGGSEELKSAEKIYFETVIRPGQLNILKVVNKIMKINDLELLDIERLSLFPEGTPNNEEELSEEKVSAKLSRLFTFLKNK